MLWLASIALLLLAAATVAAWLLAISLFYPWYLARPAPPFGWCPLGISWDRRGVGLCGKRRMAAAAALRTAASAKQEEALPCGGSRWGALPDAAFALVLGQLEPPDFGATRAACSGWRSSIDRCLEELSPTALRPASLATAFPTLVTLDLSRCRDGPPLPPEGLVALSRLQHLRQLRLGSSARLAPTTSAVDNAPTHNSTTNLDPGWATGAGRGGGTPVTPGSDFEIAPGFVGATDAGLSALAPLQPQLAALDLSGCVHIGDTGLLGAATALFALRELRLRRCGGVSDVGMLAVALLGALTLLDVSGCPLVTNLGLRALSPLPLQFLNVSRCPMVRPAPEPDGGGDTGCLDSLSPLLQLRTLLAHGQGSAYDSGQVLQLPHLQPLRVLKALRELSLGTVSLDPPSLLPALDAAGALGPGATTNAPTADASGTAEELAELLPPALVRLRLELAVRRGGGRPADGAASDVLEGLSALRHLRDVELTSSGLLPSQHQLAPLTHPTRLAVRFRSGGAPVPAAAPAPAGHAVGSTSGGSTASAATLSPLTQLRSLVAVGSAPPLDWSPSIGLPERLEFLEASGPWLWQSDSHLPGGGGSSSSGGGGPLSGLAALSRLTGLDVTIGPLAPVGTGLSGLATGIVSAVARATRLRTLRLSASWAAPAGGAGAAAAAAAVAGTAPPEVLLGLRLSDFSALQRLETLDLGPGLGPVLSALGAALPLLTALTSLTVQEGEGAQRASDSDLLPLGTLRRLRRLAIAGPAPPPLPAAGGAVLPVARTPPGPQFGGAGLAPIAGRRTLRALALGRCLLFGVPGLRAAARLGPGLMRLELAHCAGVDDAGFRHLQALSGLTLLDITGCLRLGDASLSILSRHMRSLGVLRAGGCRRFTNTGVSQLRALHATLIELELGPLPGLTEAGAAAVGALTSLTRLELRGCPGMGDAGIACLTALRVLSLLDLSGCGASAEGIMSLGNLTRIAQIVF